MKFPRALVLIMGGLAVLWVFITAMNNLDRFKDPNRVAFILNIRSVPPSVRNVDCSSDAIADMIITCAFAIDPKDFEQLLAGWQFDNHTSERNTSYMSYPNLGLEFDVAVSYSIQPKSFEHGGNIEL